MITVRKVEGMNGFPESPISARDSNLRPYFEGGIVTPFQGTRGNGYNLERHNITSANRKDLTSIATGVYLDTYPDRDRELSIERMRHGLIHPNTTLRLAIFAGKPVAIAILREMTFSVGDPLRRERVGYSTRAMLDEHQRQGLGTKFLEEGVKVQEEEKKPLDAIALMTQNVESIATLKRAIQRAAFGTKIYPFDELYTERALQDLLLSLHKEVRMSSDLIRTWNGVSEGELKELGSNEKRYRPDRSHTEAWGYNQKMVNEWGVNRDRGDVVYVIAPRMRFSSPDEVVSALSPAA